jgi:hypothetical protein
LLMIVNSYKGLAMPRKEKPMVEVIDIKTVKMANRVVGHYWFDQGTTRFFRSRYSRTALKTGDEAYFVSSEQFDDQSPRLFTLRVCHLKTGHMDTVGAFQQYQTSRDAWGAARKIAASQGG